MRGNRAAIVIVGSEITAGLRVDAHLPEIARALQPRGFAVAECVAVADDAELLTGVLERLIAVYPLVITTGGLGPTHDDVTREAAARALKTTLLRDPRIETMLGPIAARHADPEAASQVLSQADVLPGAEVIHPTTGTAPGMIAKTDAGTLALLPGPPTEMRPMLDRVLARYSVTASAPRELGVVGLTESDTQMRVQRAIGDRAGVSFTLLARPGDVRVLIFDDGAGECVLDEVGRDVGHSLGSYCYSDDGASLAHVVVREATVSGNTIATAESCTGGMLAAALTDVPGSSQCFLGGLVTYSNEAKMELLDVPPGLLAQYGAVSAETVQAMAFTARERLDADCAVAISGIAGPTGGTIEKPVGTVWFGLLCDRINLVGPLSTPSLQFERHFTTTSRNAVRLRATATALDALRRAVLGLPIR